MLLCSLVCTIIITCVTSSRAQFSGMIELGLNSTSNAVGTDTSAPDRPFLPTVDLQYKWMVSRLNSLTFEAATSPYYSSVTSDNSYFKFDLSATGDFYLSEDIPAPPTQAAPVVHPSVVTAAPPAATKQPAAPTRSLQPTTKDSVLIVGQWLASLSERLDSLDIDDSTISDDSSDVATELKDSLSESVLAVSEVIAAEGFTESVRQVLGEELNADAQLLRQIPFPPRLKDSITRVLGSSTSLLERALAKSDLLATPAEPIDTTTRALPATIVAAIKPPAATEPESAPIITLVDPTRDIADLSSSDVTAVDDAPPKTTTTLAALVHLPLQYEQQDNSVKYNAFSYRQISFDPRISMFTSEHFGLGLTVGYSSNAFPNDTLYTYNENRLRLDARTAIGRFMLVGVQLGVNFADYLHPFDSVFKGPKGRIIKEYSEPANYTQSLLGAHLTFFIGGSSTLGLGGAIARSSELRPYLVNSILGRSRIGGQATDDPYSYDLSRFFLMGATKIFWDVAPSLDIVLEKRAYGKGLLRANVNANIPSRTDNGTIVTLDLTREFPLDNRLLSVFDVITPEFTIVYTKYKSTIKTYSYNDTNATLAVTFGF